jgi:DNA polymerase-3 subunit delta
LDGLTFEEFRKQVKQGQIEPLYLFVGEERYFLERALALLYKEIGEGVSIFSIGETRAMSPPVSAATAINTANQRLMIASRRLIVIRNFDKIKEDENDLILEYLKRPAEMTTLVFQAVSLDQRRKITTALLKACTAVTFDRLSEGQATRWAEEYLRRRDCRIEHSAMSRLIGLTGTGMARLVSELDKLATYAGGGSITNDVVEQLVPRAREHSNFELWDAILERDRRRAIRLTQRVLDDGAEPVMLVGALAGLYRRMLAAKDLMARKAPSEEIMKATGQYGQRAAAFNARVLRTPREEIIHGLRRIAQVDNAIKGSEATPRLQLEYLVAELTLPDSARWGIFH